MMERLGLIQKKKIIKDNYTWIGSIIIVFLFLILFLIMNGVMPFGESTFITHDCFQQVYPFLCVLHDKLKNGDSLLYFWNGGLGINFLSTYFFYLASPLNFFVVLFEKSEILEFITFTIIIRIALSAGTFGFYLSHRDKYEDEENSIIILPLSCAYALNNFILAYYHESMWLDSFVLFPVIMLGYERLIKHHKPALYIISLTLATFFNFYIIYIIGFFLCLWFVLDNHSSIKGFLKNVLWFGGSSALAIGMSAIPLLVSYFGVNTTHVSEESMISHEWYGNIFEVLRYGFFFSKLQSIGLELNHSNIYCGTLCIVLLFIYLFIKDIPLKERIKKSALIFFMIISMNESVLNYIWHAFHTPIYIPNRFGFVFIFLLLNISYDVIVKIKKESEKRITIGLILAEAYPLICYFFIEFDSRIASKYVLVISLILILSYGVVIFFISRDGIAKKISYVVISIMMITEILINAGLALGTEIKRRDFINYMKPYEQAVQYIEEQDDSIFYRSDFLDTEVYNINSICGVNGVSVFSSLLPYMSFIFQSYSGTLSGNNAIGSYGMSCLLEALYSEKYLYVEKDKDIYQDRPNYSKIYENETLNVYKNEDNLSLGLGVDKNIQNFEYFYDEPFYFQNELAVLMTGGEGVFDDYVPEFNVNINGEQQIWSDQRYIELIGKLDKPENRSVDISFDIDKSGEYYICLNLDTDNIISIYKNGELVRSFNEFPAGDIFYIGKCEENDNIQLNFYVAYDDIFESNKEEKIGLRVARVDEMAYEKFIQYARNNQMVIKDMNSSHINASVQLNENQILFTSIPYDEGWKAYENGKEITIKKIADSFVGLELGEGAHNIELVYRPSGLYIGIVVSVISWSIFIIFILLLSRMSKQTDLKEEEYEDSKVSEE